MRATRALRRVIGSVWGERVAELDLSTRTIIGHLQITGSSLWVWYSLAGQRWAYSTLQQREQTWDQLTARLARLAGHAIRLRTSTKPFPAYEFARALDADTSRPLPDVPGAPSWNDYLAWQQQRLHSRLLDDKIVTLGVRVGAAPNRHTIKALQQDPDRPAEGSELAKLLEQLRELDEVVAGAGMNARPLSAEQMAWLMYRSVALGMPVPSHAGVAGDTWESEDLFAFTDPVNWHYTPMGSTVRLVGTIAGREITRHVAVLSVGRMAERSWPESRPPWMLLTDRMGFPVEWSVSGVLVRPSELTKAVTFERNRAIGIEAHYAEHDEEQPPAVARAIEQASRNYDEVTEGDPRTAVRFAGPVRLAVHAPTREECLSRARKVIDAYADQLRIEIAHPQAQAEMLREFIPGEPWATTGYQRRFSVGYLAAAMPHVTSNVGTRAGPYLGYTIGTARRAVLHDAHVAMETLQRPGLIPVAGEPGAGKSYLLGLLAYHSVKCGEPTAVLDPSGPLGRLCDLPDLVAESRRLDLTSAEPGSLSPWALIPDPQRHDFPTERDFTRAISRTAAERQQLAYDVMRMQLPAALLNNHRTDAVLHDAVRTVGGDATVNPRWVLDALDRHDDDHAQEVGKHLRDAAEFPLGELICPDHSRPIPEAASDARMLVVITMPGISLPDPDMPRERWSTEERASTPLLHLAAFYTSRHVYGKRRNIRKNLMLDETHVMAQWGSGRSLFVRLARDSRKWNLATYASSQHPDDHLGIGKLDALIGSAFVGRLEDESAAKAAMRLLRTPEEYASTVMNLSPPPPPGEQSNRSGEFLYRDAWGRVEKIRIDARWHSALHEALISTPSGKPKSAPRLSEYPQPTPFLDAARWNDPEAA